MATVTETENEEYVDFDQYIDFQVNRTRSQIRSTDLMAAAAGGVSIVLAYLLIFVVLDHWVIPGGFSSTMRWVLLAGVLSIIGGWTWLRLSTPYFSKVSRLFAARELEDASEEMRSSLMTLVDLRDNNRKIQPEIQEALEKRAAKNLSTMDVEEAIDRKSLLQVFYMLLAVVLIFCAYAIFSPKKISTSIWRALLPVASIEVPTKTTIVDIDPGDHNVLARSLLDVSVYLSGDTPEEVTLYYTTDDRRYVDEAILMREVKDVDGKFSCLLSGENGRGLLQNHTYRIVAGDAESQTYTISVKRAPIATINSVELEFPKYMELPARKQSSGDIDAWEGTVVELKATANMPVKSAIVRFSDTEDLSLKAEEIPLKITNGNQLSARWRPLEFRTDGSYPKYYRIECRNEDGDTDPSPSLYHLKIRPDQSPEVQLLAPRQDLERPSNAIVPMILRAHDPDFQLRYLTLRVEKDGESIYSEPLFDGSKKQVTMTHDLKLEPLRLKTDEKITFWIEARDNKQPLGNRKNSTRLNIRIIDPLPTKEEVQKDFEKTKEQQLQDLIQQGDENDTVEELDNKKEMKPEDKNTTRPVPNEPPEDKNKDSKKEKDKSEDTNDKENGASDENSSSDSMKGNSSDSKDDKSTDGSSDSDSSDGKSVDKLKPKYDPDGADDDAVLEKLLRDQLEKQKNDGKNNPDNNDPDNEKPDTKNSNTDKKDQKNPDNKSSEPNSQDTENKDSMSNTPNKGEENKSDSETSKDGKKESDDSNPKNKDNPDKKESSGENPKKMTPDGSNDPGKSNDPNKSNDEKNPSSNEKSKDPKSNDDNPSEKKSDDMKSDPSKDENNSSEDKKNGDMKSDDKNDANKETPTGLNENKTKTDDNKSSENGNKSSDKSDSKSNEDSSKKMSPDGQKQKSESSKNKKPSGNEKPSDKKPNDEGEKSSEEGKKSPENKSDGKKSGKESPNSKPNDKKPTEKNTGGKKPGQKPQDGNKNPNEKSPGKKPSEMKPSENPKPNSNNGDPKKSDNKSPDGKKPSDQKPGSKKPSDKKPEGNKPDGKKSDSKKPADGKPSDKKSEGGKKPGEGKKGGGEKSGEGKKPGSKPGDGKPGDGKGSSEKPGQGKGNGKKPGAGKGKPSDGKPGGKPDPMNQPPEDGKKSNSGSGVSKNVPDAKHGKHTQGGHGNVKEDPNAKPNANGGSSDANSPESLEDRKKAANLVLKKMKENNTEANKKLLEDLGWTEKQLSDFRERMSKHLEKKEKTLTQEEIVRKRQFEEMLKNIDLKQKKPAEMQGGKFDKSNVDSFAPGGDNAPPQYRELEEAFKRSLSRKRAKN